MSQAAPTSNKWLVLIVTALGGFMGALMFTSVNVALPTIMKALGTEFNVVQWVVLSYLLATSTLLPIVGRLADMLGKKVLYITGYVVFTIGSLLCGIAPNIEILIVFRAIQGLGGAFLTALGLAIITDTFPAEERGKAIGINGSILSVGVVAGPTLGGLLAGFLSWRWIFLITFIPGLLASLLAWRYIPKYERSSGQTFDILGAILLFIAILSLLLGLTFGQGIGFSDTRILLLFGSSVIFTAIFIWLERRVSDPLIDLSLFKNAQLSIGLITGFLTFISISGAVFLIPFYLSNVLGYSVRNIGLLMSVVPLLLVIIAPIAGSLADRYGERPVTLAGLIFMFIGYGLISTFNETTTAVEYLIKFAFVGLGMATFQTPNNSAIMGAVDRSRSGVAGGLLALTRTLGSTSGIAVIGTIWAVWVVRQAGNNIEATNAPAAMQVTALDNVFSMIQIAIFAGIVLVVWDIWQRRKTKARVVSAAD